MFDDDLRARIMGFEDRGVDIGWYVAGPSIAGFVEGRARRAGLMKAVLRAFVPDEGSNVTTISRT